MASVVISGDTSGAITISAPAVAGTNTLTLPVATDTLVGKTTTDTLTNKTLTSPTLTTPALGTPASGVMTNVTGINYDGYKNRIINGAMVINQRGYSATPTADTTYTLDRWEARLSQASKFSVSQSSTAPTGFNSSLLITSASAYSCTTNDFFDIDQQIEGYNSADLGWGTASAATVTISFWVRSSLTGTFGGALANADSSRAYPFSYSISSANTWEQKTITLAGDTSGTWQTTSSTGIQVRFSLGVGTTYGGTAGAWVGSNKFGVTGQVNVVGTNGATFYITGVQLEKGSTATSFDYRPYGTELALCQRYYYLHASGTDLSLGDGSMYNTTVLMFNVNFPVSMRTAPTLVQATGTNYYRFYRNNTFDDFDGFTYWFSVSTRCGALQAESNISGTAGQAGRTITNNASASIAFNSEL